MHRIQAASTLDTQSNLCPLTLIQQGSALQPDSACRFLQLNWEMYLRKLGTRTVNSTSFENNSCKLKTGRSLLSPSVASNMGCQQHKVAANSSHPKNCESSKPCQANHETWKYKTVHFVSEDCRAFPFSFAILRAKDCRVSAMWPISLPSLKWIFRLLCQA